MPIRRLLFACLPLALGCCTLCAEIIDRIAIAVGNQVITTGQIDEEIRLTAFLNRDQLDLSGDKKKAADRLIEQTLVKRDMELSRYPLPALSEAAEALKSVKARYSTEAQYQQALQLYGITEDGLTHRLWWQMTLMRFIDYRFRPGIQVPDADIQTYYQQQLDKWRQQGITPIPTLEDSRESIEQLLTEQRIDLALDKWLADARTQMSVRYLNEDTP
jgi:peptidyl-prolyl cis-trans isomerase SurA